ncbi:MAG: restriction endonuclease subunit S [Verrucomicrobia bacterium]|nr:restriction endonuclease subunit S [Verrucomicrobiota bacterium]
MKARTKTTAAKEDGKPALVPKLRFPEFRESDGWNSDELGKVADFVNEKVPVERVALASYVSTENILPDYGGVTRASKLPTAGSVTQYRPNDTLVSNIRPYLKKVWVADKEGGASNDVIVIRAKHRLLPKYFSCLLKNDAFIDYVMTGAKGVKMPRGDIGSMKEYPTLYPSTPEQQKIAECLSSVDDLIAAQARKLDALKTHKKGLMQQLFPREGETQPRLRFPEFHNAGEWDMTRLGRLGELVSGLTYSPDDVRESGLLVLRSSNVQQGEIALDDCVYVDPSIKGANLSQPNDILICVRNGSKALIGKCALIPEGMPLCTHGAFMTVFRAKTPSFVFQLFQSDKYQKQVAGDLGATINSINGGQLLKYEFFVPKPPEQQRIAACLTALDDLITAQTQKLEVLKTHKKALMQQLFPSPEEVEA